MDDAAGQTAPVEGAWVQVPPLISVAGAARMAQWRLAELVALVHDGVDDLAAELQAGRFAEEEMLELSSLLADLSLRLMALAEARSPSR